MANNVYGWKAYAGVLTNVLNLKNKAKIPFMQYVACECEWRMSFRLPVCDGI